MLFSILFYCGILLRSLPHCPFFSSYALSLALVSSPCVVVIFFSFLSLHVGLPFVAILVLLCKLVISISHQPIALASLTLSIPLLSFYSVYAVGPLSVHPVLIRLVSRVFMRWSYLPFGAVNISPLHLQRSSWVLLWVHDGCD